MKSPTALPAWVWKKLEKLHKNPHPKQKFQKGDVVLVDNNNPNREHPKSDRSHFTNGIGIIMYSYKDAYPQWWNSDREQAIYSIDFGPQGQSSWHPEDCITLVRKYDATNQTR